MYDTNKYDTHKVNDRPYSAWLRFLLLCFVLLAFARVTWQLDAKNFWWDESLTLQRAESDWSSLLRGTLIIKDGVNEMPTTDQHPFLYFVLTGILIRLAGTSEFAVRFISAMAATVLVPSVWIFARQLVKSGSNKQSGSQRAISAQTTPIWSALFAAISPFFLWYGQEARPYALWSVLALLCTYLLLKVVDASEQSKTQLQRRLIAYLIALALFLSTQYLSVLLLPLHAIVLFLCLRYSSAKLAFWAAVLSMGGGLLMGTTAASTLLRQDGAGSNFFYVPPTILLPDLLNAFSLGLSVDINQVWWFDLLYGLVALLGALWILRAHIISARTTQNRTEQHIIEWLRPTFVVPAFILPAFILIPITAVLLINYFVQPVYMNARHMSFLGGGFLLLLGSGLAALWQIQRIVAGLVAIVLISAAGYSSINYFISPEYGQKYDDYSSLSRLMEKRLLPDDIVLLKQAFSWRIFDYYLPLDQTQTYSVPFVQTDIPTTLQQIDDLTHNTRRVWLITSGTTPKLDKENQIETHLNETMYRVQTWTFYSQSKLTAKLFLPTVPVYNEAIAPSGIPVDVLFGEQIRLISYQVDQPNSTDGAVPVTLTWQTQTATETRYKYILELVGADGQQLGITEREPYDGAISTNFWQPGQTIVEFSEVPPDRPLPALEEVAIRLQIYASDTLEKLQITTADLPANGRVESDVAVVLPAEPAE